MERATLRENLRAQVAYTWLDARYRDTFLTCTVTPCAAPNLTDPGRQPHPGHRARLVLRRRSAGRRRSAWRGGVEARALSKVLVNDANSDAAAGFAIVNANVGYVARVGSVDLTGFARVDNLFGRNYAGSVIVNEGNARYFEPAPTRNWTVGLTATLGF